MIKPYRIQSIDLLRGIVMIFMALDHVRDYFHADAFLYDPTDLDKTSVVLFFTRFITHYCAPVFVFLAGTSAFLVGVRKGKKELSAFLLKRGLWLVFLEVVVVNFGWSFNFELPMIPLIVIWAIGIGMITLAGFIHLPFKVILGIGIVLVAGHNALDGFSVEGNGASAVLWSILHQPGFFPINEERFLFVGYPVIPWIGIMLLGYCLGTLYQQSVDAAKRKTTLLYIGSAAIVLFLVLRLTNLYGDASLWTVQETPVFTFLSFLKVSKYPPSLLYALVTLGPAIIFLAFAENIKGSFVQKIIVLGRVPMFYYILHIYLIHVFAIVAALLTGYSFSSMIFNQWINFSPELKGYGFGLPVVYLVWIGLVILLYFLCKKYNDYKTNNPGKWWLSYL
jgi:uncharacterized membrane protein